MKNEAFLRPLAFWTEERSLTLMLWLLGLNLFAVTPATLLGHTFRIGTAFLLSLALLAGLLTLVRQQLLRRVAAVLVSAQVAFKAAALFSETSWVVIGDTLLTLLALAALVFVVLQQVAAGGAVTAHRIRGAIAEYLLIAMLFAFLYGLIEELSPGAFNLPDSWRSVDTAVRGDAFYYFSIVTLTTVGFGDITPAHPFVRSLVMLEALIGQLYPAILLARLVTLELETRRTVNERDDTDGSSR